MNIQQLSAQTAALVRHFGPQFREVMSSYSVFSSRIKLLDSNKLLKQLGFPTDKQPETQLKLLWLSKLLPHYNEQCDTNKFSVDERTFLQIRIKQLLKPSEICSLLPRQQGSGSVIENLIVMKADVGVQVQEVQKEADLQLVLKTKKIEAAAPLVRVAHKPIALVIREEPELYAPEQHAQFQKLIKLFKIGAKELFTRHIKIPIVDNIESINDLQRQESIRQLKEVLQHKLRPTQPQINLKQHTQIKDRSLIASNTQLIERKIIAEQVESRTQSLSDNLEKFEENLSESRTESILVASDEQLTGSHSSRLSFEQSHEPQKIQKIYNNFELKLKQSYNIMSLFNQNINKNEIIYNQSQIEKLLVKLNQTPVLETQQLQKMDLKVLKAERSIDSCIFSDKLREQLIERRAALKILLKSSSGEDKIIIKQQLDELSALVNIQPQIYEGDKVVLIKQLYDCAFNQMAPNEQEQTIRASEISDTQVITILTTHCITDKYAKVIVTNIGKILLKVVPMLPQYIFKSNQTRISWFHPNQVIMYPVLRQYNEGIHFLPQQVKQQNNYVVEINENQVISHNQIYATLSSQAIICVTQQQLEEVKINKFATVFQKMQLQKALQGNSLTNAAILSSNQLGFNLENAIQRYYSEK